MLLVILSKQLDKLKKLASELDSEVIVHDTRDVFNNFICRKNAQYSWLFVLSLLHVSYQSEFSQPVISQKVTLIDAIFAGCRLLNTSLDTSLRF